MDIVLNTDASEILSIFSSVDFHLNPKWWYVEVNVSVSYSAEYTFSANNNDIVVSIVLNINASLWSAGWSLIEFSTELKREIDKLNNQNIYYHINELDDSNDIDSGFSVYFTYENINRKIKYNIDNALNSIEEILEKVNQSLVSKYSTDSLLSVFDFPESIRFPCEQYLMYFGQFLKDLGIDAETEIKEKAHSTLFTVTPKDKFEAIDKIKEALDVYINTPVVNDLQFQNMNNGDMAFMQFQANVMHLKSQVLFLNATLQMKDATIEALQLSNYQLKNLGIGGEEKKEQEEIIPGILSVQKFEGKGFTINIPEIIRRLRRIW